MAIITLTTDFGNGDEYVGLMKAAILSVDRRASIVDITHGIDAQDVVQAAFSIESSYTYFPAGTIHVVVVDPGVGTQRPIIGMAVSEHFFIAPDNGTMSLVLKREDPGELVRIENSDFFLKPVSSTFHGRDIMAPAAAHLGCGVGLSQLGPGIDASELVTLVDIQAETAPGGHIDGRIIAIDRFGNLITNIAGELMQSAGLLDPAIAHGVNVRLDNRHETRLLTRYADAAADRPLALISSRGYLEIAVNNGSAQDLFGARKGQAVRVFPADR